MPATATAFDWDRRPDGMVELGQHSSRSFGKSPQGMDGTGVIAIRQSELRNPVFNRVHCNFALEKHSTHAKASTPRRLLRLRNDTGCALIYVGASVSEDSANTPWSDMDRDPCACDVCTLARAG